MSDHFGCYYRADDDCLLEGDKISPIQCRDHNCKGKSATCHNHFYNCDECGKRYCWEHD